MYVAKSRGTGVQVYSTEIDRHSTVRLGLLAELRAALENNDLELHYQPKADLRTGDVVGVEALLRWRHPERGLIHARRLPAARRADRADAADHQVRPRRGAAPALDLVADRASGCTRRSTSARSTCTTAGSPSCSSDSIESYDVPPRALDDRGHRERPHGRPVACRVDPAVAAGLGVGVSLDDFGTGYSSLVHLKRLPVTEVKIDRSFVMRMDVNEDDAAIVRSIIDLAGALGLRTVAEGVETREAWDRLAVVRLRRRAGLVPRQGDAGDRSATDWLKDVRHVGPSRRPLTPRPGRLAGRRGSASRGPIRSMLA